MTSKVVFISGASRGIGLATAQQLHSAGWHVLAGGLPDDDFSGLNQQIERLPFDITDADAVADAAAIIKQSGGRLDALVNNAGIQISGSLEELPIATIRRQLDVNVIGHLQVIQAMLPLLREAPSARIVNVSSLMGQVALPLLGAYSMSKHALEALSDTLRLELEPAGITVSVVAPGAIDTPMNAQAYQSLAAMRDQIAPHLQAHYHSLYHGMLDTLSKQQQNATSADAIASVIVKALTTPQPKARYTVGMDVKGLSTIRKILPDSLWDRFLTRILGIK